jgi:anti-sigma-K factor RskA
MTPADEHEREPGGDDMFAAEYVLGVLPADERQIAAHRIAADAGFARLVEQWEERLSPLATSRCERERPVHRAPPHFGKMTRHVRRFNSAKVIAQEKVAETGGRG